MTAIKLPELLPTFRCTRCDWSGDNARLRPLRMPSCPECLSQVEHTGWRNGNTTWSHVTLPGDGG